MTVPLEQKTSGPKRPARMHLHRFGRAFVAGLLLALLCGFFWRGAPLPATSIEVAAPGRAWHVDPLAALTVQAEVFGRQPTYVTLAYRTASDPQWTRMRLRVVPDHRSGRVRYEFPQVRESLRFFLEGGGCRTGVYEVAVNDQVALTSVQAFYEVPAYLELPDRVEASADLMGMEGTRVRLVLGSSVPLARMVFQMDDGSPEELSATDDEGRTFEKILYLTRDCAYTVWLHPHGSPWAVCGVRGTVRVVPLSPPLFARSSRPACRVAAARESLTLFPIRAVRHLPADQHGEQPL